MSVAMAGLVAAAARIAGRISGDVVLSWTSGWRAAFTSARRAKKHGLPIGMFKIRAWLNYASTKTAIKSHDPASLGDAADELAQMLPHSLRNRESGEKLLEIVLDEILKSLPAPAAIAELGRRQKADLGQHFNATNQKIDELHESLRASSEVAENLRRLPPIDEGWTLEVCKQWPNLEQIIREIASSAHGSTTMRQWGEKPPEWLGEAPISALKWLGILAAMYGQDRAADTFFRRAIAQGATPRNYWIARRAFTIARYDEDSAKRLLEEEAVQHPLGDALTLSLNGDLQGVRQTIIDWVPEERSAEVIKAVILSKVARVTGNFADSIQVIDEAIANHPRVASLKLESAQTHLEKAVKGLALTRLHDAQRALQLAVEARDYLRAWGGESSAAVVTACRAAMVLEDYEFAWRLTRQPPEGDATIDESRSRDVLIQAAIIAAGSGRVATARDLAKRADDFTAQQIEAMIASTSDDLQSAIHHWNSAWVLAGDDPDRMFRVAHGLAQLGEDVPQPERLAEVLSPENLQELGTLRTVMARGPGRLARLRSNAYGSALVSLELSKEYERNENHGDAARVLEDAAETFRDASMMLMASRSYVLAGAPSDALRAAQRSIALAPPTWSGISSAYGRIVQLHMDAGDGELATQAAERFVYADPESDGPRWLLVRVHLSRGNADLAWRVFGSASSQPAPTNAEEALIWIQLNARFATSDQFFQMAENLLSRWSESRDFCERALSALHSGSWLQYQISDDTANQLRAATEDYFSRFGSEGGFREVQFESPEAFLELVADELRQQHENIGEIARLVRDRRFPIGAFASLSHRTYTEASVRRVAGEVFARDFSRAPLDLANARQAIDGSVLIDITTLHTLAILDEALPPLLQGSFTRVVITDHFFADVSEAVVNLGRQSGISAVWDSVKSKASITMDDDASLERLRSLTARMLRIASSMPRVSRPEVRHARLRGSEDGRKYDMWLNSLDLAIERNLPYWCDDVIVRQLALEFGVAAFDTFSLLHVLSEAGSVKVDESAAAIATAIHNYYSEFEFDEKILALAVAMDGTHLGGSARALMRPIAWLEPERVLAFVLNQLRRVSRDRPDHIVGWVYAVTVGLIRVADEHDAAFLNILAWMNRLIAEDWCDESRLPYVLRGIHDGRNEHDIPDPVPAMIEGVYSSLVRQFERSLAAKYLLAKFALCDERDRSAAARAILLQE